MELRTLPDLCGRLTAIQDSIDGMPDEKSVLACVRRALMDTPGISMLYVSLEGSLQPEEPALDAARRAFANAADAPANLDLAQLQIAPEFELFPAATPQRLYGFLAASLQDNSTFAPYRSYFKAVAGIMARSLEARRRFSELADARSELEAHLIARRCAESLYYDSQKKNWEAQDIAGIGSWDWSPATESYHWSQTLTQIFGRNPNRPPPDFEEFLTYVHPNDRKAVRDSYSKALKTGAPLQIEYRIVRFDGEERIVEAWAKGFRNNDGKLVRIVGAIQDVTGLRREGERLRREAAYARSVIEAAPDPLLVVNAEGNITDANDAASRMFGASKEQLLDSDFASWFETPEQARTGFRTALAAEYIGDVQLTLNQSAGEPVEVQMNASLYRGAQGETTGAIASIRDVTEFRRHEEALAQLPEQMTTAMAELQQRERDTAIIAELNQTLQTCNTQDEAYPLIAVACEKLFPWASGALALFVNPAQELSCAIKWGPAPAITNDFVLDDCWGLRRGQLHQLDEPGKGAVCRHFEKPPEGPYMCLPLSVHGEAFGVLHLSAGAGAVIDEAVRRSFTALGDMVKLSLSNLKLRESLRFQAVRDPLTNLYNRQYLSETLAREVSRAKRHRLPLSVAMLDIDYFKVFNDEHGHEAGDAVLKEVGALLRTSVRTSDIACRYGGEEFLFVLPECDLLAARARVEHICQEIKHRSCMFHGHRLPPITMSAGIAQFSDEMAGEMELIETADRALYAAKGSGRDRIGM